MEEKNIVAGLFIDENTTLSFIEVCHRCNITEADLLEMLDYGLFTHEVTRLNQVNFGVKAVQRIQSACRLQQDLGINLPGVVLVLELLDELEQVREQLDQLQPYEARE